MEQNPYKSPVEDVKKKASEIASDDRKWGLICYIPIINILTCAITAVMKVKSKFAVFHARQGLVLFVCWFVTILIAFFSPVLSLMMWGAVLLLHAAGMVIAYAGNMTKIPVLGDLAMRIPETYIFTLLTQKTPEEKMPGDEEVQGRDREQGHEHDHDRNQDQNNGQNT